MSDNYRGQVVFMADDFDSKEDYQQAVIDQMMLLMTANYKMKIYTELGARHQTIIQFGDDHKDFEDYLVWLNDEEVEVVDKYRCIQEEGE